MNIEEIIGKKNIGIVEPKEFTFGEVNNGVLLDNGTNFGPVTVAYETYGTLNEDKSNAILVCHALTGDGHAAGYYASDIEEIKNEADPKKKAKLIKKKAGWWDDMIGPGKPFNTDEYFVISSNILSGCKGTTGPSSINPATGKPYAMDFPIVTIGDMVRVQKKLTDYLGIEKLYGVVGGSYGGMQVLEWTVSYPDMVNLAIVIATTARVAPQAIAFDTIARRAITNDPNWNNGNYYDQENQPDNGLATARMIGHLQYLSSEAMHQKWGRKLQDKDKLDYNWDKIEYEVESYLDYQGDIFIERFDANSYLYITKAMDYFDLSDADGSFKEAFKHTKAKFLVISFSTDWLFPTKEIKEFVSALRRENKDVAFSEIETDKGHDAFLLEFDTLSKLVTNFIKYNGDY